MPSTTRWRGIVVTAALRAALLMAAATWVILGAPDWAWVAVATIAGGALGMVAARTQCWWAGRR